MHSLHSVVAASYGRPVRPAGLAAPSMRVRPAGDPTPTYMVVHASGLSTNPNTPTKQELTRAFRNAQLTGNPPPGDWVGPTARVVRHNETAPATYRVHAAWLYRFSHTDQATNGLKRELLAGVQRQFRDVDTFSWGGWTVTTGDYREAINGPIAWWQCPSSTNCASVTQTMDVASGPVSGIVDVDENPVGPTTALTHPTPPADAMKQSVPWGWILGIGGVLAAGYLVVKGIKG